MSAPALADPQTNTPTDAPKPRWPLWAMVLLAVIGMFVAYAGYFLVLPLYMIPGVSSYLNGHFGAAAVATIVQDVFMAACTVVYVWAVMKFLCRRRLRDAGLFFTRRSLPLFLLGVGVSVAITVPTLLALNAAGLVQGGRPDAPIWFFIVQSLAMGIIMQGFPEELLFRGYVMQLFERRPLTGVAVSTVVFGLMHLISQAGQQGVVDRILYLVTPTGFGFCAAALVLLTKSLWTAVGIHGGSHTATMIALMLGSSDGGRAAWVSVGVGYFIVGAVLLAIWRRRRDDRVRFEY